MLHTTLVTQILQGGSNRGDKIRVIHLIEEGSCAHQYLRLCSTRYCFSGPGRHCSDGVAEAAAADPLPAGASPATPHVSALSRTAQGSAGSMHHASISAAVQECTLAGMFPQG